MRDRHGLVQEVARVLRPGGRVVWCDIVRRREIDFLELRTRRDDFRTLRAAFGDARMDPVDTYRTRFVDAGLIVDHAEDLTAVTRPTFARWRRNSYEHEPTVVDLLGLDGLTDFRASCDILDGLWEEGTFGYALLSASKSQ
jgi:27-O-demethylrifamycin SV methyltransferase